MIPFGNLKKMATNSGQYEENSGFWFWMDARKSVDEGRYFGRAWLVKLPNVETLMFEPVLIEQIHSCNSRQDAVDELRWQIISMIKAGLLRDIVTAAQEQPDRITYI